MAITTENYRRGFLMDEELMGGITEIDGNPPRFAAFVLRHTTGEYLGFQEFDALHEAVDSLNAVQRSWNFEATSQGCGACADGTCGVAQGTGCRRKLSTQAPTCSDC